MSYSLQHALHSLRLLAVVFAATVAYTSEASAATCVAADNGGTANVPESCTYVALDEPMQIIDGLPMGDTVLLNTPRLGNHSGAVHTSTMMGEDVSFQTELIPLSLTGTGGLAGFSRTLTIPMTALVHNDPRTSGAPVQSFSSEVMMLQGQIVGDPDFDLLRITAGTSFGLPSPGHTTLTQAGSDWGVDSFFDITYRIDFIGSPTSSWLAARSGSTTATTRFTAESAIPVPAAAWLFGSGILGLIGIARRRKMGQICFSKPA